MVLKHEWDVSEVRNKTYVSKQVLFYHETMSVHLYTVKIQGVVCWGLIAFYCTVLDTKLHKHSYHI